MFFLDLLARFVLRPKCLVQLLFVPVPMMSLTTTVFKTTCLIDAQCFIHALLMLTPIHLILWAICSKSYCPFCVQVKKLLTQLGASFKAIEMDTESK